MRAQRTPEQREPFTEVQASQKRALGITSFSYSSNEAFEPKTLVKHCFCQRVFYSSLTTGACPFQLVRIKIKTWANYSICYLWSQTTTQVGSKLLEQIKQGENALPIWHIKTILSNIRSLLVRHSPNTWRILREQKCKCKSWKEYLHMLQCGMV